MFFACTILATQLHDANVIGSKGNYFTLWQSCQSISSANPYGIRSRERLHHTVSASPRKLILYILNVPNCVIIMQWEQQPEEQISVS